MIYGIGTDIVKIGRIKKLIDKYEEKFIRKILSESELNKLPDDNKKYEFIAEKFAGKEAFYKAMGKTNNIGFTDIDILNDADNKPFIANFSTIKNKIEHENKNGAMKIHVSISHEIDYATAFVVIEII